MVYSDRFYLNFGFSREMKISCRRDITPLIVDGIIFNYKDICDFIYLFTSHKGSSDHF